MTSNTLEDNLRKVPPQNLEAEASVLGGVLLDNQAITRVLEILTRKDFYRESHRKIFQAMIELSDKKEPIDLITLSEYLCTKGELDVVGGAAYLACLANLVPTVVNITHYAGIVRECSKRRAAMEVMRTGLEQIDNSPDDTQTIVGRLTNSLLPLQNGSRGGFEHIGDVVTASMKNIERAHETKTPIPGIPTGLVELEETYGAIRRGDLLVVGGRTSMGKTSLAASITRNTAGQGYPVAFVSAESPPNKITIRLLAQASGIENVRLQSGILKDGEHEILVMEAGTLSNLPIWFLGNVRSWDSIKAYLRGLKMKTPDLALVVIDYCQLLSAPVPEKRRYLEVSRISSEAKGLAGELDVVVMLLSQLNREVEKQQDKRPKLSELRESGSLEQDADLVFLLYWPYYYNKNVDHKELTELIVAKNRDGRTGDHELRFQQGLTLFTDWLGRERE